jgi:uncharacterized protein YndB with AHSA1/START domain
MTPAGDTRAVARHETIYSTPSDRELVITRTFDAPRTVVWAAFTDPKHVPNWQTGPAGTTMPVCEIDLRPGGTWHYVWRNVHGREFTARGTYREVDPPKRLVLVSTNNGEEQTNTTTFTEETGRTHVTVSILFASRTSRDRGIPYAKIGTDTNYATLDAYLARNTAQPTNQENR